MRRHRKVSQGTLASGEIAVAFGLSTDRLQRRFQCFAAGADRFHIGRALGQRPSKTLRRLLIHDSACDILVQCAHSPVEQPQRLGAEGCVLRRQRVLRIAALQVIDDGPQSHRAGAIHVDENRQLFRRVLRRHGIEGQPFLGDQQPREARRRR